MVWCNSVQCVVFGMWWVLERQPYPTLSALSSLLSGNFVKNATNCLLATARDSLYIEWSDILVCLIQNVVQCEWYSIAIVISGLINLCRFSLTQHQLLPLFLPLLRPLMAFSPSPMDLSPMGRTCKPWGPPNETPRHRTHWRTNMTPGQWNKKN